MTPSGTTRYGGYAEKNSKKITNLSHKSSPKTSLPSKNGSMSSQVTISTKPSLKRSRRASTTAGSGKKKSRSLNVSRNLVRVGQAFPKTIRTVLRYVEYAQLSPGGSSYDQFFFKCNGLNDPTDAIGGHQPYAFDQYAAIYNHYKVYKAKATVQFSATDASRPEGVIVGVNITPGASDADVGRTKMEKQDGKINYEMLTQNGDAQCTIVKTWNCANYFGLQKDESELSAAVTADPTELSHFCIWAQNLAGAATYAHYNITIEYFVEFSEPKSLGGS